MDSYNIFYIILSYSLWVVINEKLGYYKTNKFYYYICNIFGIYSLFFKTNMFFYRIIQTYKIYNVYNNNSTINKIINILDLLSLSIIKTSILFNKTDFFTLYLLGKIEFSSDNISSYKSFFIQGLIYLIYTQFKLKNLEIFCIIYNLIRNNYFHYKKIRY